MDTREAKRRFMEQWVKGKLYANKKGATIFDLVTP